MQARRVVAARAAAPSASAALRILVVAIAHLVRGRGRARARLRLRLGLGLGLRVGLGLGLGLAHRVTVDRHSARLARRTVARLGSGAVVPARAELGARLDRYIDR